MFARALLLPVAALFAASAGPAAAQPDEHAAWIEACKDWDEWDKPGPPFKVHGNTYYVGTCGIGAVLITSEHAHILIDGGTEAGADLIAANIEKLGFRLGDVEILLHSHEHHDHVGGLARLKQLTGATLAASPAAARAFASGRANPEDPQFAPGETLPKVPVDDVLAPDGLVAIGPLTVRALDTPGHTPGALSWYWESCEGEDCLTIVYADSLSPVSSGTYRFSDHPEYLAGFRASLTRLAALDCDILLTPHPSASGMRDKLLSNDFGQPPNCAIYAEEINKRLDERLAREATASQ